MDALKIQKAHKMLSTISASDTWSALVFIAENPGINSTQILFKPGIMQCYISYQITRLLKYGIISQDKKWKSIRNYPDFEKIEKISNAVKNIKI